MLSSFVRLVSLLWKIALSSVTWVTFGSHSLLPRSSSAYSSSRNILNMLNVNQCTSAWSSIANHCWMAWSAVCQHLFSKAKDLTNKHAILDNRTHFKPTEAFQYFSTCHPPGDRKGFIKGEAPRPLTTNSSAKSSLVELRTSTNLKQASVRETTPTV